MGDQKIINSGAISQVEVTPRIHMMADKIVGKDLEYLQNARKATLESVVSRPYTEESKGHEASIRWRRTADQILKDGWVYQGKACTDLAIVFIALCRARGYQTSFVKLTKTVEGRQSVHSVVEVKVESSWYIVDVGGSGGIVKGRISLGKEFNGYSLWKKGRDAWDLGLVDFESIGKIT